MARPVRARPVTVHLIMVTRMARSLEVDERIEARRKRRLLQLTAQLIAALQKEIHA